MIMFFYMFCLLLWAGFLVFLYKKYKKINDTKKNILLAGGLVVALMLPTLDLFGMGWYYKESLCSSNWTGVRIIKKIPGLKDYGVDSTLTDASCPAWADSRDAYKCTIYKDKTNELVRVFKQKKYNLFIDEYISEIWEAKTQTLLGIARGFGNRKPLLFDLEFSNVTDFACSRNPDGSINYLLIEDLLEN